MVEEKVFVKRYIADNFCSSQHSSGSPNQKGTSHLIKVSSQLFINRFAIFK